MKLTNLIYAIDLIDSVHLVAKNDETIEQINQLGQLIAFKCGGANSTQNNIISVTLTCHGLIEK